jgi:hypothetical protein
VKFIKGGFFWESLGRSSSSFFFSRRVCYVRGEEMANANASGEPSASRGTNEMIGGREKRIPKSL